MKKSIYTQIKEILAKHNLLHKVTYGNDWINKKDIHKIFSGYIVVYEKGTHPEKDQIGWIHFNNQYHSNDNCWMSDWSLNDHPYSKEIDNL